MRKFFRMPKKEIGILLAIMVIFTSVLVYAASFEFRNLTGGISKSDRVAYAIAATGTTFDHTFDGCGILARYVLEIPQYTNSTITTTLSLIDSNSVTIYTGAAHTSVTATNYSIPIDIDVYGGYTVRLTLSNVAGGAGNAYVTFLMRQ